MTLPLAAAPPQGLSLFHGDERQLIDAAAAAWLAAARVSAGELDVEVLDAPAKLDPVRRSLSEVPLFDPQRFLLVRDPPQLSERGRRGADGPEALVEALEARAPTTAVCLVAHLTVAPTNPVLQAAERLGARVVLHPRLRPQELRDWLERRIAERGLTLPAQALDYLLGVDGADTGGLENELDKLAAFGASGPIALPDVWRLVVGDPAVAVWDVLNRLTSSAPGGAARAIDELLEDGAASQYLLASLAGQLRDLLLAQELLREHGASGGGAVLARELRLPNWRADRLARQARALSPRLVERWLRSLQRLEVGVKAGEANDVEGLRTLVLRASAEATVERGRRATRPR